jgi:hypothetical protein
LSSGTPIPTAPSTDSLPDEPLNPAPTPVSNNINGGNDDSIIEEDPSPVPSDPAPRPVTTSPVPPAAPSDDEPFEPAPMPTARPTAATTTRPEQPQGSSSGGSGNTGDLTEVERWLIHYTNEVGCYRYLMKVRLDEVPARESRCTKVFDDHS